MSAWWRRAWLAFALLATCASAAAHEMSIAEMEVRELAKGEFFWVWTSVENKAGSDDLVPQWPAHCAVEDSLLHCGDAGLAGELSVRGVGRRYSAAIVHVDWIDGTSSAYTLTSSQPTVRLYGSADDRRGFGEIASAYLVLGVEHILTGVDHLLFVIGLLFLVGFNRRLLWTITAFTLAHSVTLASSALGWLTLRPAPVEAVIALSIVLVAAEALHRRRTGPDTLARRWPALVAFLFGLVHGLGFAGALKAIGLPQAHLPVALLTFNLGVEIGQLLTVSVAWLLWRVSARFAARWPRVAQLRPAALYAIGIVAAYWSWLRIAALAG